MRFEIAIVLILLLSIAGGCSTKDVTGEEPSPQYPCDHFYGVCLDSTGTQRRAEVDFFIQYVVEEADTLLDGHWVLANPDSTDPSLKPFHSIDHNDLLGSVRNGQIWFTLTPGWYDTGMYFEGAFLSDSLDAFSGRWFVPGFSGVRDHGILYANLLVPCP